MAALLVQIETYGAHRFQGGRILARGKVHGMAHRVGTGTMARNNKFNLAVVRSALIVAFVVAALAARAATPCDGVDHSVTRERSAALASAIAKQENVPRVDVLQSFRFHGWSIIYVETYQSDEVFLFYAHDPLRSHTVTEWSGAARIDEGKMIEKWAEKNALGIPSKLAGCFAWYVTNNREL